MKNFFLKRIAITLALLLFGLGLFAQQPDISINMIASTQIPYSYDEVIKLPNGDLKFLRFSRNEGELTVSEFSYLSQPGIFTEITELGTISGFTGLPWPGITLERFGKLYTIHRYPLYEATQGFVITSFDADGMNFRVIDELDLGTDIFYHADLDFALDIIAEGTLAIALPNKLICYNLSDGSQSTILEGDSYPSGAQVIAVPNGHFLFAYFTYNTNITLTFIVFDTTGNQVCTVPVTDRRFDGYGVIDQSWSKDFSLVDDRFYLTMPGILYNEIILEGHFPTPDSLHFYLYPDSPHVLPGAPTSQFVKFADDMMFRAYWNYGMFDEYMSIQVINGHYADNPQVILQKDYTHAKTHVSDIGNRLLAVTTRGLNVIVIDVFCPLDFPTMHHFYFGSPLDYDIRYVYSKVLSHGDKMLFVSGQHLFVFDVDYSNPNADEVQAPAANAFTVYPNPVNAQDVICIKHSLQQQVELDVFNIRGQKVKTLSFDSNSSIQWDLCNYKGEKLPTGIYLAKAKNMKNIKPFKLVITRK